MCYYNLQFCLSNGQCQTSHALYVFEHMAAEAKNQQNIKPRLQHICRICLYHRTLSSHLGVEMHNIIRGDFSGNFELYPWHF